LDWLVYSQIIDLILNYLSGKTETTKLPTKTGISRTVLINILNIKSMDDIDDNYKIQLFESINDPTNKTLDNLKNYTSRL
jgi:hypothetical protein